MYWYLKALYKCPVYLLLLYKDFIAIFTTMLQFINRIENENISIATNIVFSTFHWWVNALD